MANATTQSEHVKTGNPVADKNLQTFDRLDFESWNKKDMEIFEEIHTPDVVVHYPDGTKTVGYDAHEKWAAGFFDSFDSKIHAHPIKTATGDWTSVVGDMEVTFARPLKTPDGKSVPATMKTWRGRMCTVARWKDGRIQEEILFWDNAALFKGVGLA